MPHKRSVTSKYLGRHIQTMVSQGYDKLKRITGIRQSNQLVRIPETANRLVTLYLYKLVSFKVQQKHMRKCPSQPCMCPTYARKIFGSLPIELSFETIGQAKHYLRSISGEHRFKLTYPEYTQPAPKTIIRQPIRQRRIVDGSNARLANVPLVRRQRRMRIIRGWTCGLGEAYVPGPKGQMLHVYGSPSRKERARVFHNLVGETIGVTLVRGNRKGGKKMVRTGQALKAPVTVPNYLNAYNPVTRQFEPTSRLSTGEPQRDWEQPNIRLPKLDTDYTVEQHGRTIINPTGLHVNTALPAKFELANQKQADKRMSLAQSGQIKGTLYGNWVLSQRHAMVRDALVMLALEYAS